ncbi:MAG: hypothetical protein M3Z85_12735 [Acidobacteriota bacterium]|nr:hypothetical protein [Acidobacteriota bacterium]
MRNILRSLMIFLLACSAFAADISGTWVLQVETSAGSGSPTFTFKQNADKLTGRYSGALGEADVTGTVSGDQVEFSFKVSPAGEEMTVTYKGTITAPDKMKGTAKLGTLAEGTWEGSKK